MNLTDVIKARIAAKDKRYAELFGLPFGAPTQPIRVGCSNDCDELSGEDRNNLGLDHRRKWLRCKASGNIICLCQTTPECGKSLES